jgi:hypothetical protein
MAEYKPSQYPPTPLDTKGHLIVDYSQVNAQLQYEAGRFDRMISGKIMQTDPWNRLVVQDDFPESLGTNIQSLMWERVVLPEVGPAAWTDLTLNDGTGNSCIPNPQILEYARTVKSYNLQQSSFRSPYLCVEDIRYAFKFGQQLAEMYKVLEANSSFFTTNRYRDEYLRLCGNHIVVDVPDTGAMSNSGSNQPWPASRAAYALDQGMLDNWYLDVSRDNGEGAYGKVDGQNLYALICSPETSMYLKKSNPDMRQDLRFSSQVDDLLKPFGVGWSYGGFMHLIDLQAPRYTFTGGAYKRVPFYTTAPATYGRKAVVNPAYSRAPFEVSFIYNKEVYISRVPTVITNPGGNTSFKATNYRGKIRWMNIQDNDTNLEGTNGFFFSKFVQGSEPNRTEWGYAILHQRCGPVTQYKSCS